MSAVKTTIGGGEGDKVFAFDGPRVSGQLRVNLSALRSLIASNVLMPEAVWRALQESAWWMLRETVENQMSGQKLRRITSNAAGSMEVRDSASAHNVTAEFARAWFGSAFVYVRAHELGVDEDVTVRAHVRSIKAHVRKIEEGRRKAYRRKDGTRVAAANVRAHKQTVRAHEQHVGEYTYRMRLKARGFMRAGMKTELKRTERRVRNAILHVVATGQLPEVGQIGSK